MTNSIDNACEDTANYCHNNQSSLKVFRAGGAVAGVGLTSYYVPTLCPIAAANACISVHPFIPWSVMCAGVAAAEAVAGESVVYATVGAGVFSAKLCCPSGEQKPGADGKTLLLDENDDQEKIKSVSAEVMRRG